MAGYFLCHGTQIASQCTSLDPEPITYSMRHLMQNFCERMDQVRRLTLLSFGARPPLAGRSGQAAAPGSSSGTLLWHLQRPFALAPQVLPAPLACLQHREIDTGNVLGFPVVSISHALVSSNRHASIGTALMALQ